jgi:hypothetical protein
LRRPRRVVDISANRPYCSCAVVRVLFGSVWPNPAGESSNLQGTYKERKDPAIDNKGEIESPMAILLKID